MDLLLKQNKVIGQFFFNQLAFKNQAINMHFNPSPILQGLFLGVWGWGQLYIESLMMGLTVFSVLNILKFWRNFVFLNYWGHGICLNIGRPYHWDWEWDAPPPSQKKGLREQVCSQSIFQGQLIKKNRSITFVVSFAREG